MCHMVNSGRPVGGLPRWSEERLRGKSLTLAPHQTWRGLYTGTGTGNSATFTQQHIASSMTNVLIKNCFTQSILYLQSYSLLALTQGEGTGLHKNILFSFILDK